MQGALVYMNAEVIKYGDREIQRRQKASDLQKYWEYFAHNYNKKNAVGAMVLGHGLQSQWKLVSEEGRQS